MKRTHTKILALLLALTLLCMPLTACKTGGDGESSQPSQDSQPAQESAEPEPESIGEAGTPTPKPMLTIAIELDPQAIMADFQEETGLLLNRKLRDYTLMVDLIPQSEPDHSNHLTQMRVELMAGGGPDVFIENSREGNLAQASDGKAYDSPMLPYPQKMMENNSFLPLDSYIAEAENFTLDDLFTPVLEAGQNSKGEQVIMPFNFELPVISTKKEIHYSMDGIENFDGILNSGDKFLEWQARRTLLARFGEPADFLNETLNFTEEDLLQMGMGLLDHGRDQRTGAYEEVSWENGLNRSMNLGWATFKDPGSILDGENGAHDPTDMDLFPMYNKSGGVTATIVSYMAVNANTAHPEAAFAVIDQLMSKKVHQETLFSSNMGNTDAVSIRLDITTDEERYRFGSLDWGFTPEEYAQFLDIREKINSVRFFTPLDREADSELWDACTDENATEETVKQAVHKSYTTMQMMLGES